MAVFFDPAYPFKIGILSSLGYTLSTLAFFLPAYLLCCNDSAVFLISRLWTEFMLVNSRFMLKMASVTGLVLGIAVPASADFRFTPYGAIGANISHLSPDTDNSGFDVDESTGAGFSLLLGADIADRWSIEAGYNDLGSATLENPAVGEEDIDYSAFSLSALYHLFGDTRDIADRRGGWTYLRLGVNQIDNDSNLELDEEDSSAIWAGIGYEYSFSSLLSVRGEIATFDGDAQAVTAALVLRPFSPPSSSRGTTARAPSTRPATRPAAAPLPAPLPSDNPRRLPIPTSPTAPSIADNRTVPNLNCEAPVGNEPLGPNGCAQLSGVRGGLDFANESAQLLPASLNVIAQLARAMNQAPNLRIEVRAHAESAQGAQASQELSRQRVVAVARALVAAGVQVDRLGARAFGNQEPIVNSGASAGNVLPNRIEFVVSP